MNKGISGSFGLGRLASSSDTDVSVSVGAIVDVGTVVGVGRGVA